MKRSYQYFAKHPHFNAIAHTLAGIGIGMLLVYPIFEGHTVRYGLIFLSLGLALHAYPLFIGKK